MINEEYKGKIKTGARVKVWETFKDGDKERQSAFEGVVISRKHGSEIGATFTVRGRLGDYALEKIYPINSPLVSKVEVLNTPKKVKKSKLYFVRKLSVKKTREKIGQGI
ncbi:MAG: 50S ribosomal protein L19 [Patescibacteria group bacterium]|nr:50S ribosomal protein L19 [Patescibacteria group bacterium]MCL5262098.1 50S ribosomal protein L19 [Patescibacteria group bacterium]